MKVRCARILAGVPEASNALAPEIHDINDFFNEQHYFTESSSCKYPGRLWPCDHILDNERLIVERYSFNARFGVKDICLIILFELYYHCRCRSAWAINKFRIECVHCTGYELIIQESRANCFRFTFMIDSFICAFNK